MSGRLAPGRASAILVGAILASSCAGTPAAAPPASPTPAPVATPLRTAPPAPTATAAATPSASPSARLRFVAGSTAKVEQLIGDTDYETKQPTQSRSGARYGVRGTDLGNSFEHQGKTYFLFGDTIPTAGDPVGFTSSADPERPIALDFLTDAQGRYLRVQPDGKAMGGLEVPVSGISLGGVMYLTVKTGHSDGKPTETSWLVRYDEAARTFTTIREISKDPNGRFVTHTLRAAPDGTKGLPAGGPWILMFGSGYPFRQSDAYLAIVPVATFASGAGTRYFSGSAGDAPRWSDKEADAAAIVRHQTIGDLSVSYVPQVQLWVMTYESRDQRGIVLRYASSPWGPWSDPQVIFEKQDGVKFIYDPRSPQLSPGPVFAPDPAEAVAGAPYGPYIIERFTRVTANELTLGYVLSTWNPYTVVRMRSRFSIER